MKSTWTWQTKQTRFIQAITMENFKILWMILYLYTDMKKPPQVTRLHNQLSRFDYLQLQITKKNIMMIIKDEKVIANRVFHTKQNASTTLIQISRRC